MAGPPNIGPARLIFDVVGDVPDWKEEYKKFLLAVKDSEGYFRYRWGPWKEDMTKLEIMATWDSPENRAAFGKSPQHQKAIEALTPVLAGPMPAKCPRFDLDISTFRPPPPQVINSPICEVITVRNCRGNAEEMAARLKKAETLPGCFAAHSGVGASNTSDQGTVWLGFVGWRDFESSKDADKSVYMPHDEGDVEAHHINFNFPIKGFSVTNPGR
ncbi:hypothetical protein LX32DRAFT_41245 [Colletotrichum zoysiae]|uniref:ABM domain-containing protein n=1 Tax=Colletotrichum zoysiae TaxID=1216348 RepID=A0AAD9HR66_9PEZI|nr:hypothetical protein LX32DRAFT_41245 [Colletotrichum zoysiae]